MPRTTISRGSSCRLRAAALVALASGLLSCGKKGDPLPPLRPVPATAENLSVRQVGDRLLLRWTAPARNEDGTTEGVNLREALVWRRVVEPPPPEPAPAEAAPVAEGEEPAASESTEPTPAEGAEPVTAPAEPPASVEGQEPEAAAAAPPAAPVEAGEPSAAPSAQPSPAGSEEVPAASPAQPVPVPAAPPFEAEAVVVATVPSTTLGEVRDHEEPLDAAWIGKRVEFAVRYVNGKDRESAFSPIAAIEPAAVVGPPRELRAEEGDGLVALEWGAPESGEPLSYFVFRRPGETPAYPDTPLNPEPIEAPRYEDRTAAFGSLLCYVATARISASSPASPIESVPSEEVCLTPVDRFPPPVPEGLVAVVSSEGILLSWSEVEAPDRRAYRVYRAESPDGPFELLAEAPTSSYTDAGAVAGTRYFYAVTAVDASPAGNESERSAAVEALRP